MERHFHEELKELRDLIIRMASKVDAAIDSAVNALTDNNDALADKVIDGDDSINQMEITIDEKCLHLLALQQPMAIDLRFITSAMKINNDLERMGDHAVNIAKLAKDLNKVEILKPYLNIPRMAAIVQSQVRESINSFVNEKANLARKVCQNDDEVDQYNDQIFRELLTYMIADTKTISRALNLVLISKNLERIADLATNIAEEVIFIYRAKSIKHHADTNSKIEDFRSRS